jgi:hypothetical protein
MEGIEYLKHGDLTRISKKLGVSRNHVRRVKSGECQNERISGVLNEFIKIRKSQFDIILNNLATEN